MKTPLKPKSKPSIFLLDRMPWEKELTIRLCIPGVHEGRAVWLESKLDVTLAEARDLLRRCSEMLGCEVKLDESNYLPIETPHNRPISP